MYMYIHCTSTRDNSCFDRPTASLEKKRKKMFAAERKEEKKKSEREQSYHTYIHAYIYIYIIAQPDTNTIVVVMMMEEGTQAYKSLKSLKVTHSPKTLSVPIINYI